MKKKKNSITSSSCHTFVIIVYFIIPTNRAAVSNCQEREKAIRPIEKEYKAIMRIWRNNRSTTRIVKVRKYSYYRTTVSYHDSRHEWGRRSAFVHIYERSEARYTSCWQNVTCDRHSKSLRAIMNECRWRIDRVLKKCCKV